MKTEAEIQSELELTKDLGQWFEGNPDVLHAYRSALLWVLTGGDGLSPGENARRMMGLDA